MSAPEDAEPGLYRPTSDAPATPSTASGDTSDEPPSDGERPAAPLVPPGPEEQEPAPDAEPEPLEPKASVETDVAPEPLRQSETGPTGTAVLAEPAPTTAQRPAVRPLVSGAWASLLIQQLEAAPPSDAGWATVSLDLGEGEGTMAVRARQDDGRLVVAVQLSDPAVRAAAQNQADEIRSRLEQHYGTSVDLAFEHGSGDRPSGQDAREPARSATRSQPSRPAPVPTPAPTATASRREWIG